MAPEAYESRHGDPSLTAEAMRATGEFCSQDKRMCVWNAFLRYQGKRLLAIMAGAQAPKAFMLPGGDGDEVQTDLFIRCRAGKGCSVHVRGLRPLCVAERGALQPPEDQALAHSGLPEQVALEDGLGRNMPELGRAQDPAQKSCITCHGMASHGCSPHSLTLSECP